jgi:hypothetical protein
VSMSDAAQDADALRERLSQIEEQPLEERADAFAQVHSQLQTLLEGNDTGGTNTAGSNNNPDGTYA